MANNQKQDRNETEIKLQIPLHLSLKEVLLIFGGVVTILGAWGAFQTKVTLIEQRQDFQQHAQEELKSQVKDLSSEIRDLRNKITDTAPNSILRHPR